MKTFRVWRPEWSNTEDDGRNIPGWDAKNAAERYADMIDTEGADYLIVGGQEATICVRDGDRVRTFVVTGETVAHYSAREKTEP